MNEEISLISKLDFGHNSAESETDILPKVFVKTAFFERVQNFKKWLVLGRKGSGKTATRLMLYKHLTDLNQLVTTMTPGSLSAAKSALLEKSSLNQQEAATLKWKFVFLVECCRYIIHFAEKQLGSNYFEWPQNIREVRKFLVLYNEDEGNTLDKAIKFVRNIKKIAITVLKVEGSLELESSPESKMLDDDLDKVMSAVQEAMQSLLKEPIYILIDEVDDLWDSTEIGYQLIIGLLQAAKEINDKLPFVRLAVFLRSDIFDYLQFHNRDHFWTHIELINWKPHDLKKLLALRIRNSTSTKGKDVDSIWNLVFPSKIDGRKSFEYIADYTLMRPRDFIQLCSLCRDEAHNRQAAKIELIDIHNAIPEYSRRQLEGLASEYSFQYPFLQDLLLRVFYDLKAARITRTQILERLKPYKDRFIKEYGQVYFEPVDTMFQILYIVGLIGVISSERTLYESAGDKFLLPYASKLEIHPAFRAGLRIPDDFTSSNSDLIDGDRVVGSGAIAQGEGATAVGERGVNISGSVGGAIVTGGSNVIGQITHNYDNQANQLDFADLNELVRKISKHYTLSEIQMILFDLNLDYEDLAGDSKFEKVSELIAYLQRRGRISDLLNILRSQRPNVEWP